jgi:AraC-like DNA-binding protein
MGRRTSATIRVWIESVNNLRSRAQLWHGDQSIRCVNSKVPPAATRTSLPMRTFEKVGFEEIALLSGFADQRHLNSLFRRHLFCTPVEYRKMRLEPEAVPVLMAATKPSSRSVNITAAGRKALSVINGYERVRSPPEFSQAGIYLTRSSHEDAYRPSNNWALKFFSIEKLCVCEFRNRRKVSYSAATGTASWNSCPSK